jgi:putative transposase
MSRQNYYRRRRQRRERVVDEGLIEQLVRAERRVQPRVGTRKLHLHLKRPLQEAGVTIGRDRLFNTLRRKGLLVEPLPKAPRTTLSRHSLPVFTNRLKDLVVDGPNQAWVCDLTYVRLAESFVYLSLITDRYSRKIVGYYVGDTLETEGCLKALEMAVKDLPEGETPLHHSDRGSQYCSHLYVNRARAYGLGISMTEERHCYENAMAERVNGILKQEYMLGSTFRTKEQAVVATHQAVHTYNTHRLHQALKYRTPEEIHQRVA